MIQTLLYIALGAIVAHIWQDAPRRGYAMRATRWAIELAVTFMGITACATIIWGARYVRHTFATAKYYAANTKLAAVDIAAFFIRVDEWAKQVVLCTALQRSAQFDKYVMKRFHLETPSEGTPSDSSSDGVSSSSAAPSTAEIWATVALTTPTSRAVAALYYLNETPVISDLETVMTASGLCPAGTTALAVDYTVVVSVKRPDTEAISRFEAAVTVDCTADTVTISAAGSADKSWKPRLRSLDLGTILEPVLQLIISAGSVKQPRDTTVPPAQ